METRKRPHRLLAGIGAAAILLSVAACGGDDSDTDETTATTVVTETTEAGGSETTEAGGSETTEAGGSETTEAGGSSGELVATTPGCEEHGVTDQALISADRLPARCEPGTPAPQPLAEPTTLTVSSAFSLEFMSPILLAQSLGEFEKENLEVEVVNVKFSDAVPQMAQGSIDAAVGGIELALFNAGNQDLGVKAVMGNYYPPDAGNYDVPQTGLWCRTDSFSDPSNPDPAEVPDMVWASSVGIGSISIYYSVAELRERVPDIDVSDLDVQSIPSADTVTALKNGAIDCGIMLDPLWLEVADDPDYVMMATQTPGEPLGLVAFGKNLIEDNPEAGEAFVRAVIRTINTYYAGDYHSDAEVMNEIAEQTGVTVEKMTQVPSLVFDWELREGTTDRTQEFMINAGVITGFDTPVPEDKVVDRSFYLNVVGAE